MAKTRPQLSKSRKRTAKRTRHPTNPSQAETQARASSFIAQSRHHFSTGDLDRALKLVRKALALISPTPLAAAPLPADPCNPLTPHQSDFQPDPLPDDEYNEEQLLRLEAAVLLGELHLERGEPAEAASAFAAAIALDPDGKLPDVRGGGADKFLHAGQLSETGGADSLSYYTKAITILERQMDVTTADGALNDVKAQLAAANCAAAELYMTDMSFEPDAEEKCESFIGRALRVCPQSVDALQALGSMRISQERVEEAREALRKSMAVWSEDASEGEDSELQTRPPFSTRVGLVRILAEVQMLDQARMVLKGLREEDDASVEVLYLSGWVAYLGGETVEGGEKVKAWGEARGWFEDCLDVARKTEYEDERLMEHAAEILRMIDEGLGGDDEWVDEDEDGETGEGDGEKGGAEANEVQMVDV